MFEEVVYFVEISTATNQTLIFTQIDPVNKIEQLDVQLFLPNPIQTPQTHKIVAAKMQIHKFSPSLAASTTTHIKNPTDSSNS